MRRSSCILIMVLFLSLTVSPLLVYAHGMVDQKQETSNATVVTLGELVGQEFVPSESPLLAVDFLLTPMNPQLGDDTLTVNIRESSISGAILGSVSQPVANWTGWESRWIHFDLPSPVNLTPGSKYVIQLIVTKYTFGWCYSFTDPYPSGRWIRHGVPDYSFNYAWCFRTYAASEPMVGGTAEVDIIHMEGKTSTACMVELPSLWIAMIGLLVFLMVIKMNDHFRS